MNLLETRMAYQTGQLNKPEFIDAMHVLHTRLFEYSEYLHDTDIASIEITDAQVLITSRSTGIRMICDKSNKRAAPIEILNFGSYEKDYSNMMLRLSEPNFCIFDIGANIGWYTLLIAKTFRAAKVHAFEPLPETYNTLVKNIEINHALNVCLHNFGFWDSAGKIIFYFPAGGSDNASAANLSGRDDVYCFECQVRTIDDFVSENTLNVDLIKCDVEGAELLVLKGGIRTIRLHKPILFAEMLRKWSAKFNYHPNEIITLLNKFGYHCYTVRGNCLQEFDRMTDSTLDTNFCFLHREKHALQISSLVL